VQALQVLKYLTMGNRNVIFVVIFGICISGCNTEGHRGSSANLTDAQQRKTLIGQFEISSNDEEVSKIIGHRIEEAFIEYSWFVKPPKSVIDTSAVNLVLKMQEGNTDLLTNRYEIRAGKTGLFTRHSNEHLWLLVNNFNSDLVIGQISKADTIKFKLYEGDRELGDVLLTRHRASTQQRL
jgi:hypothetical protein